MKFKIHTNAKKKAAYEAALQHIGNEWRSERDPEVRFMHRTCYEVMKQVNQAAQQ